MKHLSLRLTRGIMAAALLIAPAVASAAFFSSNEVVEVDQPVKDTAFLAGERVRVREAIEDDAYVAGGTLEIEKAIGEDLMAAGNSVTLDSTVGDDAYLAGDRVVVDSGSAADDLFAAGRSVEVREGTTVKGDAYLAGADVTINGSFQGTVRTAGDTIEVGPKTHITGDLIVHSQNQPTIAGSAVIDGTVRHIPIKTRGEREGNRFLVARWIRDVVTLFVVTLVLLYLAPRLSALVLERIYTNTLSSFGLGFLWLIACVPAVILLLISIIGWPLAGIVIFLTGLLFALSALFMPLVVGTWLTRKFATQWKLPKPWQHALLGAVVVVTIHFIPALGPLLLFVLTLSIMGVLIRLLRQNA